ncbi:hypothetical protein [Streptomyces sp. KL2]
MSLLRRGPGRVDPAKAEAVLLDVREDAVHLPPSRLAEGAALPGRPGAVA